MMVTWGRDSTVRRLAVLAGHFWCSEAASWASNMRLFWNFTWFQLRVHGPALVDVRRFHHVTLHVYLRMHNRSLTGKHHPRLSSYSWFCLGKKHVGNKTKFLHRCIIMHYAPRVKAVLRWGVDGIWPWLDTFNTRLLPSGCSNNSRAHPKNFLFDWFSLYNIFPLLWIKC